MEEKKLNLKPFDIQKAREGKPVCTRDGRNARIICFDREFIYEGQNYCIVALINDGPHNETVYSYTENGLYNSNKIHNNDLMMFSEKKERWANLYRDDCNNYGVGPVYSTKRNALVAQGAKGYITTFKIEWEE